MVAPERKPDRLTAGIAWLRRVANVTSRKGQVWGRLDSTRETVVVISDPQLAGDWHGGNEILARLANIAVALGPSGWCHEVFCLDSGKRSFMNETWFAQSERGVAINVARIA